MALRLAGPDAQPLLTSRRLRGVITVVIITGGLVLVGLLLLVALFESSAVLFGVSALAGSCLFALASATDGGWHAGGLGAVERVGVALLALTCAAVAVYGVVVTITRLQELSTLGTAPSHSAFPLAGSAFALFALTVMAVVVPLGSSARRRRVWGAATATATLGLLGAAGSAVAHAAPDDAGCSRFDFEPSRWRVVHAAGGEASSRMAEAIDRCDTIPAGTSRARVRALLGRPDSGPRESWSWAVGESDGWTYETLDVEFDVGGSVTRVDFSEIVD